jgi:hypothetical protein
LSRCEDFGGVKLGWRRAFLFRWCGQQRLFDIIQEDKAAGL